MIRIILLGRTGNNLFQYALGRVLAERHGVPLLLEGSWFNDDGWKEVSHFLNLPIQARVVRRFSPAVRALRKLTGKHYWEYGRSTVIRENPIDQSFCPAMLDAPADCVLFGYFQSPLYFESIADKLRKEISGLLNHAVTCPQSLVQSLSHGSSVAVHVRRGDFLHHPAFQVCDPAYYHRAMEKCRRCLDSPRFFLFSDDPAWCRTTFTGPDVEIIQSGNDATNPLHDLRLMSLASHHVIANSTYSWWSAWLGNKKNQVVLTPPRWFAKGINAPIAEKLCPGWMPVE